MCPYTLVSSVRYAAYFKPECCFWKFLLSQLKKIIVCVTDSLGKFKSAFKEFNAFTLREEIFLKLKYTCLFCYFRRIWRSLQWSFETSREKRCCGSHKNPESWLHRKTKERLFMWSQHHGAVWPPKCGPFGRGCYKR